LGLTTRRNRLRWPVTFKVEYEEGPASFGSGVCLWVQRVELRFTEIDLFIGAEIEPDGCQDKLLRSHEAAHVEKFKQLDRQFADAFRTAVLNTPLPTEAKPKLAKDSEGEKLRIGRLIAAALDKV